MFHNYGITFTERLYDVLANNGVKELGIEEYVPAWYDLKFKYCT